VSGFMWGRIFSRGMGVRVHVRVHVHVLQALIWVGFFPEGWVSGFMSRGMGVRVHVRSRGMGVRVHVRRDGCPGSCTRVHVRVHGVDVPDLLLLFGGGQRNVAIKLWKSRFQTGRAAQNRPLQFRRDRRECLKTSPQTRSLDGIAGPRERAADR